MTALKDQIGGTHYRSRRIQPIEFIQANDLGFEEGNVIKYVTRHKEKGGAEDLKKAIQYLAFALEHDYDVEAVVAYGERGA